MNNWIKCTDRLPETHEQFIVSNHIKKGNPPQIVICAVYEEGEFYLLEWWGADEKRRIKGVTHWMPLPIPPLK